MTHFVLKTDASVRYNQIIGLGFMLERVKDNGEQDEVVFKHCEDTTVDDGRDEQQLIDEAEYLAIVYGVRRAIDYLDNERLEIRCDNDGVVCAVQNEIAIGNYDGRAVHDLLENEDWSIESIPRVLNSVADSLSKQASRDKVR